MRVTFQTNENDTQAREFRQGKERPAAVWTHYGAFAKPLRKAKEGLTLSELALALWATTEPKLDILTLMTGVEELIQWEFLRIVVYDTDGKVIPTEEDGQPISRKPKRSSTRN